MLCSNTAGPKTRLNWKPSEHECHSHGRADGPGAVSWQSVAVKARTGMLRPAFRTDRARVQKKPEPVPSCAVGNRVTGVCNEGHLITSPGSGPPDCRRPCGRIVRALCRAACVHKGDGSQAD